MKLITTIGLFSAALIMTGCATTSDNQDMSEMQKKNSALQAEVDKSASDIERLNQMNIELQASRAASSASGSDLLPPNAKPGECYARILTPATYQTETREVLKKPAGYSIEVTKPEYEMVSERILVKEASEIADVVPAKYDWKVEKILVSEGYDELVNVPAVYKTKTEKVMVKSAYSTWKKGRGPIEKVNNATGEIMCLIEVPAEYKTVTSKVVVSPAATKTISHPAVYKEVKKRVMVEGPKIVKREIPAEYRTIKVKKVVKPAQEKRIEIPAVYQTVSNRVKTSDSYLEWRSILCETNTTGDVVRNLQRALMNAGHNPGSIDGVLGSSTMDAVKSYQKQKNLAYGQLTIETLKSLGVNYK